MNFEGKIPYIKTICELALKSGVDAAVDYASGEIPRAEYDSTTTPRPLALCHAVSALLEPVYATRMLEDALTWLGARMAPRSVEVVTRSICPRVAIFGAEEVVRFRIHLSEVPDYLLRIISCAKGAGVPALEGVYNDRISDGKTVVLAAELSLV